MTVLATMFHRVPVDRITSEARDVRFTRTMLTALAGLLWLVGWSVGKVFTVVWFVLAWSATAVRVGWSDARPSPPRS